MLNKIFLLILLVISVNGESLELKNITFVTENDSDIRQDQDYSYGSELGVLFYRKDLKDSIFHIPFTDYKNQDSYFSISYAQKIYTPEDIENSSLIKTDRPYAGYMYLKPALHQAYNNNLKSLSLQLGLIGHTTQMDKIQRLIHTAIGSDEPKGWEHQLKNELILQLNYTHKRYIKLGTQSVFIPELGVELGNASTKAYVAGLYRYGNILPKDYGTTQIENSNYNKIPLDPDTKYHNGWSYSLNLLFRTSFVARDIFLDGNTFADSHSVEKKIFVAELGYGISVNYKNFSIDYLRRHTTHQFNQQNRYPSYGSFIFSYNF
ncbi:MAG: lipid A deacylase LpxR family protein [Sulfurimonas sp.]